MKGEVDFCIWNGSAESNFSPQVSSFKIISSEGHISIYFFWCYCKCIVEADINKARR